MRKYLVPYKHPGLIIVRPMTRRTKRIIILAAVLVVLVVAEVLRDGQCTASCRGRSELADNYDFGTGARLVLPQKSGPTWYAF